MVQQLPGGYVFDPADPRAPTDDQWAAMAPAERARVVAMLPAEVHAAGDRAKDYKTNVERYARLGITEYFIFDVRALDLRGHRLAPAEGKKPRAYRPVLPQRGRWASAVLGLDLAIDGGKIRFFHGNAPLLEAAELVDSLGKMLDEMLAHKQEAEEQTRAAEERAADLERQLREAQAEIARLKSGGTA